MFLKASQFFWCVFLLVPHAISQVIPTQTYSIYQPNGYTNPSANPSSDYSPYFQDITAQNQLQSPNLTPSLIRQALLNKILSSPSAQQILDLLPNKYGGILTGSANYQSTPNLANNYFVVPTDSAPLNRDNNDLDRSEKPKSKSKKRKSRKKQANKQDNQETHSKNELNNKNKVQNSHNRNGETNRASKKGSTKGIKNISKTENNKENHHERHKTNRSRKRKNKEEDHQLTTPTHTENRGENLRPKKRQNKPKSKRNNTETINSELETPSNKLPTKESLDIHELNEEGINNENRVPRNPISDKSDLLKAFPNLPEEYASNFFSGFSTQYNNPVINDFFAKYYQSIRNNRQEVNNKPKRRRKPKKNRTIQTNKKDQISRNTTEEVAFVENKDLVDSKNEFVSTERTVYIKERVLSNLDSNPLNLNSKSINIMKNEDPPVVTESETPSDDFNGYDSNYNYGYGYVDDYYPNFMDSAAYANDKQYYVKKLNDNRLLYTTDKIDTEPVVTSVIEEYEHLRQKYKEFEREKHINTDLEQESIRNVHKNIAQDIDNEVITFKTPPLLESPDFVTRQIDKTEIKPEVYYIPEFSETMNRFVGDKSPSYSKSSQHSGHTNEIDSKSKDKSHNIETVFAKSKVVNYGPAYRSEENTSYAAAKDSPWNDDSFQDGDTVYVLAKTLDNPEVFW